MSRLPREVLPDTATIGDHGALTVGGCDLLELADTFGTPLFVYDELHLRARCREVRRLFGEGAAYASKAFLCGAMAQLAHEEGLHLDIASGGEHFVARAAGVPADRLILHGNNKSVDELRDALADGVGRIVVDSDLELDRIERLVRTEGWPRPRVLVRITPGIEARTHAFISTGQDDSKFGFTVSTGAAADAVARAAASDAMVLVGVHAHIGSQVLNLDAFAEAVAVVARFAAPLELPELSVGGGLGATYVGEEPAPSVTAWGETILEACTAHGVTARIHVEPGRSIVAGAAITLYRIGTIKHLPGIRTYVAVDGGVSDNPRVPMYGSRYEAFLPRAPSAARDREVTVVGKHCESGDVLVRAARLPADVTVGDVVATPVTGAYGHSMSSNYNKLPRPAVVFVGDGHARVVVEREERVDLVRRDPIARGGVVGLGAAIRSRPVPARELDTTS